jgi:hypothetical protein
MKLPMVGPSTTPPNRALLPLLAAVLVLLNAGCRGGADVPAGWRDHPDQGWLVSPARDREPRLQVMIHYDRIRSTHIAVRVTSPDAPAVFWDPGGAYGLTRPSYGRTNDIILAQPPDLTTWWNYRQRWLREPFMVVFEWDLPDAAAVRMRDALLSGAERGTDDPVFRTRRTPGLCNLAVCNFLRRFASPPLRVAIGRYWLPDTLALRLWTSQPDRVLWFAGEPDAVPTLLLPPDEAWVRANAPPRRPSAMRGGRKPR